MFGNKVIQVAEKNFILSKTVVTVTSQIIPFATCFAKNVKMKNEEDFLFFFESDCPYKVLNLYFSHVKKNPPKWTKNFWTCGDHSGLIVINVNHLF